MEELLADGGFAFAAEEGQGIATVGALSVTAENGRVRLGRRAGGQDYTAHVAL